MKITQEEFRALWIRRNGSSSNPEADLRLAEGGKLWEVEGGPEDSFGEGDTADEAIAQVAEHFGFPSRWEDWTATRVVFSD